MKFSTISLLLCSGAAILSAADAPTIAQIYDRNLAGVEGELVPLAEAMPVDLYNFAPTAGEFKDVRTFRQQVKHIAAVNYMIAAALLEQKPPLDLGAGENGPDSVTSKQQTVGFLKDSFAYLHKALASINEKNQTDQVKNPFGEGTVSRLGIATVALTHPMNHYGQMVEYLRMNGIVPPASRGQ